MGLYNNRLQKRLEWGNNIRDTLGWPLVPLFLFLPQFVNWNIETHNTLVIIHLISLFSPKEYGCKKLFNYKKKKKKDYKICLILIVTAR